MNPDKIFEKNKFSFTVILLVLEIITVTIPVIILGSKFNFPDILRQPAENAFALFKQNENYIVGGYYIFIISSLLYIPLSYSLQKTFKEQENALLYKALPGLGITTAIFQTIGFIRWIFVMPFLTENYFSSPQNNDSVTLIYETLNRFAGMSIGEHLGFLAMGSWTICFGLIILSTPKFGKWVGDAGIIIGALIIISIGEHFGGSLASAFGIINFLSNALFTFWLAVIAFKIFKSKAKYST